MSKWCTSVFGSRAALDGTVHLPGSGDSGQPPASQKFLALSLSPSLALTLRTLFWCATGGRELAQDPLRLIYLTAEICPILSRFPVGTTRDGIVAPQDKDAHKGSQACTQWLPVC